MFIIMLLLYIHNYINICYYILCKSTYFNHLYVFFAQFLQFANSFLSFMQVCLVKLGIFYRAFYPLYI